MSIEAMKQALHVMKSVRVQVTSRERINKPYGEKWYDEAITSLSQAIAEAEKRPFTYDQMKEHSEGMQRDYDLLLAEYNLLKKDQEYSKNILVKLREKYKKLNQAIAEAEKQEPVAWKSVSDFEIYEMYNEPKSDAEMLLFARELEAELKRRNKCAALKP